MDKQTKSIDQPLYTEAQLNAIKSLQKKMRRMSKKEIKELEDEMYETTRVTLDNLTAEDL